MTLKNQNESAPTEIAIKYLAMADSADTYQNISALLYAVSRSAIGFIDITPSSESKPRVLTSGRQVPSHCIRRRVGGAEAFAMPRPFALFASPAPGLRSTLAPAPIHQL